jgi:hypothetical protein
MAETIATSGVDPRDIVAMLIRRYDIDPLDVYEGEELEDRLAICK